MHWKTTMGTATLRSWCIMLKERISINQIRNSVGQIMLCWYKSCMHGNKAHVIRWYYVECITGLVHAYIAQPLQTHAPKILLRPYPCTISQVFVLVVCIPNYFHIQSLNIPQHISMEQQTQSAQGVAFPLHRAFIIVTRHRMWTMHVYT